MADVSAMREGAKSVQERAKASARRAGAKAQEVVRPQAARVSKALEATERVSPRIYTGMSLGSIILSLIFFARKERQNALFVGMWAPTFLLFGLISRLSDTTNRQI